MYYSFMKIYRTFISVISIIAGFVFVTTFKLYYLKTIRIWSFLVHIFFVAEKEGFKNSLNGVKKGHGDKEPTNIFRKA